MRRNGFMQEPNLGHTNGAGNSQFINLYADLALQLSVGRVRAWQPPPNWSRRDWPDEITEVFLAAALRCANARRTWAADGDWKSICDQALVQTRTRYRQEWAFAKSHSLRIDNDDLDDDLTDGQDALGRAWLDSVNQEENACEVVRDAVAQLPQERDRQIIQMLFFEGHTEVEAAAKLDISQCALNNHKQRILKSLKHYLLTEE
jgi:RNA polymerase sigma factor (sigma-70 family)